MIVGAGLAGSVLARMLQTAGYSVFIVADPDTPSASRAAAGLINPVTGQRLVLQHNIDELLNSAGRFYRAVEAHFDIRLLHEKRMLRLFRNETERTAWEKRRDDPAYDSYIDHTLARSDGFIQRRTGWLDTNLLLDTLHGAFREKGVLAESFFSHEYLRIEPRQIRWRDIKAEKAIFCEGWRGQTNPWFKHLPFQPAKGEILTIEGNAPDTIINRGKWLLPIGERRCKLGATYDWEQIDENTTPEAREMLLDVLSELFPDAGEVCVTAHVAGVRPGSMDKLPFVGLHPTRPAIAIFNGFGSKGSLLIPWHAEQFIAHLLEGTPLPANADIARFR